MPVITLPDGNKKKFDSAVTINQIAFEIGPGLAKAAIAGKVNGEPKQNKQSKPKESEWKT